LVNVLGYDIGGANTKAAFVSTKKGKKRSAKVAIEYFPIWKQPQKLTKTLLALKKRLRASKVDALGLTMTAELSDVYQTKREGVRSILACVKEAFPELSIYVLTTDSELKSLDFGNKNPLKVAAANWAATGWLIAQHIKDCVVVDVGSTSTSIIPIKNGQVAACGRTDLEKLMLGELIYTGGLRTNVAAIVQSVPLRGGVASISSELFALSADIHLVLGNITEEDYTTETADGRGKTDSEALARLSRVVCADTELLTNREIIEMAKYIYCRQIKQIAKGLKKVYANVKQRDEDKIPVVVTGLGKDFLARKAAESAKVDAIIDQDKLMHAEASLATPAFGVALMTANKLEGGTVE
jgi:probable H4MPT-linked C1 transfer pathway protein